MDVAARRVRRSPADIRRGRVSPIRRSCTTSARSSNRSSAPGRINSLAQTLIKLTCAGRARPRIRAPSSGPCTCVDPDNRRPVDYDRRRRALADVKSLSPAAIWQRADEGLPKIWVTYAALQLRRRHRETFGAQGSYTAVHAQGPLACHVVAFRRGEDVMTVVPRLVTRAGGRWRGTTIPVGPRGLAQRVDRKAR